MSSFILCHVRRFCLVIFLLLVKYHSILPQFARGDTFDDKINRAIRVLKIRGAAIAYFDKAKMSSPIVRGYGNTASSDSAPAVDADSAFVLASISKTFTASAVAVLLDKGIISSLDDDICNVKPAAWKQSACRNPNYPNDKITWRMMITHRSSMGRELPTVKKSRVQSVLPWAGPTGRRFIVASNLYGAGNPTCPLEDITGFYRDILTDKPTETSIGNMTILGGEQLNWYRAAQTLPDGSLWTKNQPGSTNSYSNPAVGYVAALIELLTGQDFPTFTKENIFVKLNMTNTAWFVRDLPEVTKRVMPVQYRLLRGWKDIGEWCVAFYAAAELRTTARDLAKWGDAMLQYGAPMLWAESTGKKVVVCQEQDANGQEVQDCLFGMGWALFTDKFRMGWMKAFQEYDSTDGVWHNGYFDGVQTNGLVLPKAGVYLFVLTNTIGNTDSAAASLTVQVQKAASFL